MSRHVVFRDEVMVKKQTQALGVVLLNVPFQVYVVMMGGGMVWLCVVCFLFFGEFSETCRVRGYLNPLQGMVKIYPQEEGVVTTRYVNVGDQVKQGDALLRVITHQGHDLGSRQVLETLRHHERALRQAMDEKTRQLKRLKPLLDQKYMSEVTYDAMHDALRTLKSQQRQARLSILHEQKAQSFLIRAPIDGTVANILPHVGESLSQSHAVVMVLPSHSVLVAELYVPVNQARFLQLNQPVRLRYDAYPLSGGGRAHAVLKTFGQSALMDKDEDKPVSVKQPYYKAMALLDAQMVEWDGDRYPLRQGMTLSATLTGRRKPVSQWLLGLSRRKVSEVKA